MEKTRTANTRNGAINVFLKMARLYSPDNDEPYVPKMPVLVCRGKSPICLVNYIQTRINQPQLCIHCLEWYGIAHKFRIIRPVDNYIVGICVYDIIK